MLFDILKDDKIPLETFAEKLFDTKGEQKIIPFLGAGVSLSGRPPKDSHETDFTPPAKEEIDHILSSMNLTSKAARDFTGLAICIAKLMDSLDRQGEVQEKTNFSKLLENNKYPPSAPELAEMFSDLSKFSSFEHAVDNIIRLLPEKTAHEKSGLLEIVKRLVKITGICPSTEPLSSISNHYEAVNSRDNLWEKLYKIFLSKEEFTATHKLIARSAKFYLEQEVRKDYLIITTNYDCLMEYALNAYSVPYVVLALNRNDGKIFIRLSKDDKKLEKDNPPRYPNMFNFNCKKPMVVLYKIHGCLYKDIDKDKDGIVITDDD